MKLKQAKSRKFFVIHLTIVLSIIAVAVILNSTYSYATDEHGEVFFGYNRCHDSKSFAASVATTQLLQQTSVSEHLAFEQKVADIEFVLHQYELIDMPSFNFSVEISEDDAIRQLMLLTIRDLIETFRRDNPDVAVETYQQQSDKLILTVKLITPENGAGFIQKAILI